MKRFTRILSAVLAAMLLLGACPALAASLETDEVLYFTPEVTLELDFTHSQWLADDTHRAAVATVLMVDAVVSGGLSRERFAVVTEAMTHDTIYVGANPDGLLMAYYFGNNYIMTIYFAQTIAGYDLYPMAGAYNMAPSIMSTFKNDGLLTKYFHVDVSLMESLLSTLLED